MISNSLTKMSNCCDISKVHEEQKNQNDGTDTIVVSASYGCCSYTVVSPNELSNANLELLLQGATSSTRTMEWCICCVCTCCTGPFWLILSPFINMVLNSQMIDAANGVVQSEIYKAGHKNTLSLKFNSCICLPSCCNIMTFVYREDSSGSSNIPDNSQNSHCDDKTPLLMKE